MVCVIKIKPDYLPDMQYNSTTLCFEIIFINCNIISYVYIREFTETLIKVFFF